MSLRSSFLPLLAVAGFFCGTAALSRAHEPSKVDHTTIIRIEPDGRIIIEFDVWWGQFRAWYLRCEEMDTDKDEMLSPAEKDAFRQRKEKEFSAGLSLKVEGQACTLHVVKSELFCEEDRCLPKEAAITITLEAQAPGERVPRRLQFFDDNEVPATLTGNNEIRIEVPQSARIRAKKARTLWSDSNITGGTFWIETDLIV